MPESASHGFTAYVEPERHDGLSTGIAAPASGAQKRDAGRFVAGESAKAAGAVGGSRRKSTTQLSHAIDAPKLTEQSQKRARVLRRALAGEIAATVGAGECGIAASLFVKFASQKTAAAEEAFAAGDYETHRRLSESARMDVLYAREHAAKTAQARPKLGANGKPALPPWYVPDDEDDTATATPKGTP